MQAEEVRQGKRFEFGENWARFLALVDDQRVVAAEESLEGALGPGSLSGKTFLDVGCGSGLFSLAARRLGAVARSFDYDPKSVGCALELRRRYRLNDPDWAIGEGSILDKSYLAMIGRFDVVYAWGVLHHTGAMWQAIENAAELVRPGGRLFIALYNDQGWKSRGWRIVKRAYNASGHFGKAVIAAVVRTVIAGYLCLKATVAVPRRLVRPPVPTPGPKVTARGMDARHDFTDWVGGYPFEVASPSAVQTFLEARGFELTWSRLTSSAACNEFVFRRR